MSKQNTPVVLIVLDGWGHSESTVNNAIATARTPFYDSLITRYPHSFLDASGPSVGLPEGQIGNSEIGHMTIGAGRPIDTDLVRINKAADGNEFDDNSAFVALFEHVKKHRSTLHIKGLLSPGGIHSHTSHLYAFLDAAKRNGVENIAIHAFLDGRDTAPTSGAAYLEELEDILDDIGIGFIATASGRFYAMDRDQNWDRIEKTEQAIFHGNAKKSFALRRPSDVVRELYQEGIVDEHLEPIIFLDSKGKSYPIQDHDGIFFFNFRSDRARMLSQKTVRYAHAKDLCFVTLTEYDADIDAHIAFPPDRPETCLAAEISRAGRTQAHIAETEKYAHATYFLNGGRELPHEGEEHLLIESRHDIPTHDLAPEMRAREIADKAIEQIKSEKNFLFINFANADMVGHTANVPALITAIETIDRELKRVIETTLSKNGVAIITADHGNAEQNINPKTGEKHTAHTENLVPCIITAPGTITNGTLADITPTTLSIMNIPIPPSMTGKNLFRARHKM